MSSYLDIPRWARRMMEIEAEDSRLCGQLRKLSTVDSDAANVAAVMLERFVAEGMAADQPPAPYARVHAMGHAAYTGPIVMLPRGIRVEHHAVVEVTPGVWGIVRQWKDVHALHSIEYFGDPEWARECEALAAEVTRCNEAHRRESTDPDGYALTMDSAEARVPQYGFTTPTGEVWGWWYSTARARENAWTHADGDPSEVEGGPQGKAEHHQAAAPMATDGDGDVRVAEFATR